MTVRLGPVGLDRIVLATLNEGKAKELARLLGGTVRAVETLREHAGVTLPACPFKNGFDADHSPPAGRSR